MNNRPKFVSTEDIVRWNSSLENDPFLPKEIIEESTIKEVCYAGLWLTEELEKLRCPQEYIVRIQYTAGKLSFGRDPWEVHQQMLESYKLNKLEFEPDPANIN